MLLAILLAAAIAVAAPVRADPASTPAAARATVGPWRLSEVGGKVACTLSLTGSPAPAGWEIKAPQACRGAFPPLREVAAWSMDADGALALTDGEGRRIVAFPPAASGLLEAKAPDGKIWRLTSAGPGRSLTSRERMSGSFRLSTAGGAQCDLDLKADVFGKAGWVTPGVCSPSWSAKGLYIWTMKDGRLTLMDRKRKPVLVLKPGDPGVFVATDPAGAAVSLGRH